MILMNYIIGYFPVTYHHHLYTLCCSHNRALKPSNVYIQNNGSHVVVGDFCLPSVLSDLKMHNRPAIGQ